jgi:hypothetical protein
MMLNLIRCKCFRGGGTREGQRGHDGEYFILL